MRCSGPADTLRVDGGGGTDTLRVGGGGATLVLSTFADGTFTNFEEVDLTGTGNNSLELVESDVLKITDGVNGLTDTAATLVVTGDSGDTVDLSAGAFDDTGTDVTIGGQSYSVYDSPTSPAMVAVDNDITVVLPSA